MRKETVMNIAEREIDDPEKEGANSGSSDHAFL